MGDSNHPKRREKSRRKRAYTVVRIGGTVAIVAYVFMGVGGGLIQQDPDLPADEVDCEYRTHLIRDRLVSYMDRSTQAPPRDPKADAKFSTLLRKTRAACAAENPDLVRKLDRIERIFDEHQARRRDDDAAREELLAL